MLILGREINETIRINDDIIVTVTKIQFSYAKGVPHSVKLGFEAPKEISVHRGEYYRKMRNEPENRIQSEFKQEVKSYIDSEQYLQAHETLKQSEIPYKVTSYQDSQDLYKLTMGLGELAKSLEAKLK